MDTMETNIILRYQRLCDCWICPDCACENGMTDNTCSVCGARRTAEAMVLRAGYEATEPTAVITAHPKTSSVSKPAPVSAPRTTTTYVEEEEGGGSTGLIVAIILIIIAVIAVAAGILMYQ